MHIKRQNLFFVVVIFLAGSCGIPVYERISVFGGRELPGDDWLKQALVATPEDTWGCDPATGYPLYLYVPDTPLEIMGKATGTYYYGITDVYSDGTLVKFECIDLPGAILIEGNDTEIDVRTASDNVPPFAVWTNYSRSLTTDPSSPPHEVTNNFHSRPQNILIRVPALNQNPKN